MEQAPHGRGRSSDQPAASQRGRWWNGGASQRVRSNGLHFLGSAWRQISRTSKAILITSSLLVIIQIAATIAVLVVARNESCDKPLDLYLIIYIVRVAVASPFLVYQHLRRPRRARQQRPVRPQPQSATDSSNDNITASDPSPSTSAVPTSSPPTSPLANEPTPEPGNNIRNNIYNNPPNVEAIRNHRANLQAEWMDRVKSLLDLFAVLWFIVGNYFLFTSNDCARLAPTLFYTTLVWVLLGYLLILIPLFLCASVIFCLPCVLVALRALNIGDVPGMTGGTKEEVRAIPVYRFKQEQADGTAETQNTGESQVRTSESQTQQSGYFRRTFGKFIHRKKKDEDIERSYPSISITPAQDAICSICLSEYEDSDILCKLWCEHHFHRDCVQEWLILNSKCPLCKRDFRGKQYQDENEDEDD